MNKKALTIIALVTGIPLLVGAVGYFAFAHRPTPEPTASAGTRED